MRLLLSITIHNEWRARCIADLVPGLAGYAGESHIDIDAGTARSVAQDCRFQVSSQDIDHSLPVRQAYDALLIRLTRVFGEDVLTQSALAAARGHPAEILGQHTG